MCRSVYEMHKLLFNVVLEMTIVGTGVLDGPRITAIL